MLAHCNRQKHKFYVNVLSLVLLSAAVKKMNCSAISMTRTTATSNGVGVGGGGGVTPNGCSAAAAHAALNGTTMKNGVLGLKNGVSNVQHNGLHQVHHQHNNNNNSNSSINVNGSSLTMSTTSSTATTTTTTTTQTKKPELASKIIRQSHIVCFDVDSTVIKEEGIDELAEFCGKGAEVARVTKEAMGGNKTFQAALKERLDIIRPTQQQIAEFIKNHPSQLTRNVKRFIAQLKADGKEVYLVSGGFDCLIEPVANELNIPMTHVFANKLMFYFNGEYANFDTTQPTSKSGGKAEAISSIRKQHQQYNSIKPTAAAAATATATDDILITMIGDGATDLEAVSPANNFIGFGGNVVRDKVFKDAQYYVTDFEQLM